MSKTAVYGNEHAGKIQAEEIAIIPVLRENVARDISAITNFMHKIAARSDASFIVVGDNQGRHLFHSAFADRVSTLLVGGDNEEVLKGKTTTTIHSRFRDFATQQSTDLQR